MYDVEYVLMKKAEKFSDNVKWYVIYFPHLLWNKKYYFIYIIIIDRD